MLLKKLFKGEIVMVSSKITTENIELINKELENGASLNSLEKSGALGMSRKAFRNNALKLGYSYNKDLNRFTHNSVTEITPRINKAATIKTKEDKEIKINKYKDLEDRIKILEDIVLLNNINVTQSNFSLDSRALKNDIITRSIKVSKTALNAFNKVAEGNLSMHKKQDLISQALLEFADKYGK